MAKTHSERNFGKTKRQSGLLKNSLFNTIAERFTAWTVKIFKNSRIMNALSTYNSSANLTQNSRILQRFSFLKKLTSGIKKITTKLSEESKLLYLLSAFYKKLLGISLFSWGAGFLSCGFVTVIVEILRNRSFSVETLINSIVWIGFIEMLIGILLMTSKKSAARAICSSCILSYVFFKFFGFRESSINTQETENSILGMVAFGIIIGMTSYAIPIMYVFAAIVGIIGLSIIFTCPEAGVVLCFAMLPILPTMLISALCALVIVAYFSKLIRGKRVFRIDRMDIAILFFAVSLLVLGGVTSIAKGASLKTIIIYLLFIAMYFIVSNTLLTQKWVNKGLFLLLGAGTFSALVGIYQYFTGFASSLIWVDTDTFTDITARIIGTFDNPNVFGEFLIFLMPVALAFFLTRKGFVRLFSFASFVTMGLALVYTYSRGAWLGFLLSMFVFLILYNNDFIKLCLVGLVLLVVAVPFLPASIVNRITSIGNMADTSTAYRVGIWIAAFKMIKTYWFTGIGSGSAAFLMVYPAFALSGAAYAQHAHNLYLQIIIELGFVGAVAFVAFMVYYYKMVLNGYANIKQKTERILLVALGAGILAFLLQGMTDFVWYNYRIVLMFWMMLGITAALYKSNQIEWGYERVPVTIKH